MNRKAPAVLPSLTVPAFAGMMLSGLSVCCLLKQMHCRGNLWYNVGIHHKGVIFYGK